MGSYKGHTKTYQDGMNPRSVTDAERPWIEAWSPETRDLLIEQLTSKGCSHPLAWSIAGYLAARAGGGPPSVVAKTTRAGYRRLLIGLALPPIMFEAPVAA